MMLINELQKIKSLLNRNPFIETSIITCSPPIKTEELISIEQRLQYIFPSILRDVYLREASKISFKWFSDKKMFGEKYHMGEFLLMHPEEIAAMCAMIREDVQRFSESSALVDENRKSIMEDWLKWTPIFGFGNGDALCLDRETNKIIFYEHDVMDGGPFIHGITIADSIENLLENWAKIAFLNPFDWSEICDTNGINIMNEKLRDIITYLNNENMGKA